MEVDPNFCGPGIRGEYNVVVNYSLHPEDAFNKLGKIIGLVGGRINSKYEDFFDLFKQRLVLAELKMGVFDSRLAFQDGVSLREEIWCRRLTVRGEQPFRFATIEELIAFGAQFPCEIDLFPLLALGSLRREWFKEKFGQYLIKRTKDSKDVTIGSCSGKGPWMEVCKYLYSIKQTHGTNRVFLFPSPLPTNKK